MPAKKNRILIFKAKMYNGRPVPGTQFDGMVKEICDHTGISYQYADEKQSVAPMETYDAIISQTEIRGIPDLVQRVKKHVKEFSSDEEKLEFTVVGTVTTVELTYLTIPIKGMFPHCTVILNAVNCSDYGKPASKAALVVNQQLGVTLYTE